MIDKKRIRNRKSYKAFKEWAEFLKMKPSKKSILKKLFGELNHRYSFGSSLHALYAEESLNLVIKDFRLK